MRKEITKIALVIAFSILFIGFIFSYSGYTLAVNDEMQRESIKIDKRLEFIRTIKGSGKNRLIEPLTVAVSKDQLVYVSDKGDGLIKVFNSKGKFTKSIGKSGNQKIFKYPYGMVIADRTLWVSDPELCIVKQFDLETGELINEIKFSDKTIRPGLMTIDESNLIYISDLLGKVILIYDKDGNEMDQIKVNLSSPQGLAVDNQKNLWIGDSGQVPSLKVLNPERILSEQYNLDKAKKTYFTAIRGLAIDSQNNIFVADPMAHQIFLMNSKGELLLKWGNSGTNYYQFNFPTGLFIDEKDQIYIADRMNGRVQVWTYRGGVK